VSVSDTPPPTAEPQSPAGLRRYLPRDGARGPVSLLHSGRHAEPWATRSLLARPTATARYWLDPKATTTSQPAGRWEITGDCPVPPPAPDADPWSGLTALLQPRDRGVWLGYLSYDLARWVEALPTRAADDRAWPIIELGYCPADRLTELPACDTAMPAPADCTLRGANHQDKPQRADFEQAVQRAIDYIGAGDIFQVNLARRVTERLGPLDRGACRRLFHALARASPAWYGAYLELGDADAVTPQRVVASTSPELFLELSDGLARTRPIKGTRPTTVPAAELRDSEKDAAELNMIVDLMRNDLGRVCRFGSVRVTQPRTIETHPTIHHGVATIEGRLRESLSTVDLLRATFPAGSITGAPKVRAMQIIDELEPVRRGPYCGAIGWLAADACQLSVAIRTMLIEPAAGRVDYSVGGGIVADSVPAAEWQETCDKAAAMRRALKQRADADP